MLAASAVEWWGRDDSPESSPEPRPRRGRDWLRSPESSPGSEVEPQPEPEPEPEPEPHRRVGRLDSGWRRRRASRAPG